LSTTHEMPELLDFLTMAQNVQVIHDDEPKWLLDAINAAISKSTVKSVKYNKLSTINIQIRLNPNQLNQMNIEASVVVVDPKPTPIPMMAYTDSRGRLYTDDPMQTRLPLNKTIDMKRNSAND
jgi:hypothetical protein